MSGTTTKPNVSIESFLLEVADVVNTTLDLDTLLRRVAELIRRVIDYQIFAILLLNEKTQELRFRFAIGHTPETIEKTRVKMGEGVTGLAAQKREPILVEDVRNTPFYIEALPHVRSELAVPLIIKNRVIGVIDIESTHPNYFTPEHSRLLTVVGSRIAIGIENARLYTRVSRQARTLILLNEISRELTSILNLDELLKRIGEQLTRIIDYQMFSILLVDPTGTKLEHRFSLRFNEKVQIKQQIPVGEGLVGYAVQNKEPLLIRTSPTIRDTSSSIPKRAPNWLCRSSIKGNVSACSIWSTPSGDSSPKIICAPCPHWPRRSPSRSKMPASMSASRCRNSALSAISLWRVLCNSACCPANFLRSPMPNSRRALTLRRQSAAISTTFFSIHPAPPEAAPTVSASLSVTSVARVAAAALYAALVSGFLRSHATDRPGAAEMLFLINKSLAERRVEAQYVTLAYAIWKDEERNLQVANSGLPRPIYCKQGKIERVEAVGLPLGLFDTVEHEQIAFNAAPGDVFVFFSDGLVDATSPEGVLFGRGRIEKIVEQNWRLSADDLVKTLFQAVKDHTAGAEQFDDQTVVALKVKGSTKSRAQK